MLEGATVRDSKRALRFAMITTFYPPYHFGGDAYYVRQLCHTLVAMGHSVDVIHDVDAYQLLSANPNPDPIVEQAGLTVHRLKSRIGPLSCFLTQQTGYPIVHGRKIRQLLAQGNYDVIHYHNISLVGGPGILGYGDAIKIYTAHEHWLVCPMHVLWRHNREVCEQRECLRCSINYKRPPQLWRKTGLIERKMKHVDALFSLSHFSAAKHREFGFERAMEVMPSYIPDLKDSMPMAEHSKTDKPYFLFVGRLEKIKGLQDIIPLFNDDAAPAELFIVGTGDYEPELRRLAGTSSHVHFLGWRQPAEIVPLYAGALAAVMPSICYEVFPLVVLEAFRASTPIVARRLGPFPEIVDSSGGGILFNNQQELRAALQRCVADPASCRHMGALGRKAYEEKWSQQAAMTDYFDVIERIARQRGLQSVVEKLTAVQAVNTQLMS